MTSYGMVKGARRRRKQSPLEVLLEVLGEIVEAAFRFCYRHPRTTGSILLGALAYYELHSLVKATAIVIGLWLLIWFSVIWFTRRGSAVGYIEALRQSRKLALFKKRWTKTAESISFVNKETKEAPKVRRVRITDSGIAGIVRIPTGKSIKDLMKADDAFRAAYRCREFTITESKSGYARLEARFSDALRSTLTLADFRLPPKGSYAFGLTADGKLATIKAHLSTLLVGVPGAGKSATLWAIIASIIGSNEPTHLYVIDPAGGVELDALENSLDKDGKGRFAVRAYTNGTAKGIQDVVHGVHQKMGARLVDMKSRGVRFHIPSVSEPRMVILIDEFLLLKEAKMGSDSDLGQILTIGRKAGVIVIALSQAASVDELGATRRLFPQRLCFRVESSNQTNALLGDGAYANGAKCPDISETTPGVGYMVADGVSGYTKFRSFLVTDAEAMQLARGIKPPSMVHVGPVELEDQQTWVYRWFDAEGILLYVGISNDTARRTLEHFDSKPWANEVARWERKPYVDRVTAKAEETRAIKEEKPLYNKAENPLYRRSRKTAPKTGVDKAA